MGIGLMAHTICTVPPQRACLYTRKEMELSLSFQKWKNREKEKSWKKYLHGSGVKLLTMSRNLCRVSFLMYCFLPPHTFANCCQKWRVDSYSDLIDISVQQHRKKMLINKLNWDSLGYSDKDVCTVFSVAKVAYHLNQIKWFVFMGTFLWTF